MISSASLHSTSNPNLTESKINSENELTENASDFLNILLQVPTEQQNAETVEVTDISKLLKNKDQNILKGTDLNNNLVDVSKTENKDILELLKNLQTSNPNVASKLNAKEMTATNIEKLVKPQEVFSLTDFKLSKDNKDLIQAKEGMKLYSKNQEQKIIKMEAPESNASSSDASTKFLMDYNSSHTSMNTDVDGSKANEKNVIDSLAAQISSKINAMTQFKPMLNNENISIECNHEELGLITLNIKKHNNEMDIKILTGQLDAKNVIHENREALIGQLSQKGISVNNLSVETTLISSTSVDDIKNSQSQKFDSSSQQQSSSGQNQSRNSEEHLSEREKRNELWNILKDQREVLYA